MTTSVTFAELIRHEEFVQKTLRGLLRDDTRVEDAVQETWLRVLQQPRALPQEPRTWLAKIARHCAVSGWRSERRRRHREQGAATVGTAESAEASLGRMETRQRVVAATLALEEPYRSVVMLRYEQDLAVAAIASQLGRSPATVRSQLSRAHALLRQRLDRDFGGRERWCLLAAPLLRVPASGSAVGVGALALGLAGVLAAIAAVWSGTAEVPLPPPGRSEVASTTALPGALHLAEIALPETEPPVQSPPTRVAATAQDPKATKLEERQLPAGLLRDRAHYDDYEAATFSFEHGLRDDPDLKITRNDWDVLFDRGEFRVNTVADDRSVILDLGPMEPSGFGAFRPGEPVFAETATVAAGHAYFIGTRDGDTELATVVFVRGHAQGDSCAFDWFTTDGTNRAQGSLADAKLGQPWVEQLAALRALQVRSRSAALLQPVVRLQLRGGAGGGNRRRLDMTGGGRRVGEVRTEPLDLTKPVTVADRCLGYVAGGLVPSGMTFVVTRIDYEGGNPGDANGHGAFRIVVGGQQLVDVPASDQPIRGSWTGSVTLPSGDENKTYFEIANSSWGDVWLRGEFVAAAPARGFGGKNAGFFQTNPAVVPVRPWLLGVPSARLQVRAGMVGGNPCRIDLRGRKSQYVTRLVPRPLDFAAPLAEHHDSVAFARGGLLPEGTAFVVTKVVYSGSAKGDSNGHGEFRVVIAGKTIVERRNEAELIQDEWTGELRIVPGEESRTYLEIANSSHGDVELFGHFEKQ